MRWLAAVIGLALTALVFVGLAPAVAAAPVKLSITLSDGVPQVKPKATVTYTATVVNGGTSAVDGRLVLSVPPYAHYQKAAKAKMAKATAIWTMRVPAGKSVRMKATVQLPKIPVGELRVTTLASFYLGSAKEVPTVRTADADRIAGVKDPAPVTVKSSPAPRAAAQPARDHAGGANLWLAAGVPCGAVVLLGAGAGVWGLRRRQAARAGGGSDEELVSVGES